MTPNRPAGHPRRSSPNPTTMTMTTLQETTVPSTTITVHYRDASNYKNTVKVVLAGALDAEQFETRIRPKLQDGEFFVPGQVDLPHAHPESWAWSELDHPMHSFDFDSFGAEQFPDVFTISPEPAPDGAMTCEELYAAFDRIDGPTGWDETDWPGNGTAADQPL